ncbi:transketolase family protein [Desulfovibrio sp. TomC]|uniref:transketolase family protein n=1 Tax=Desulfovibrio sp. TomC TaxID=1562888 RepID=UPI0022B206DE|nr:transketolase C-terminal domain-containing protein [Desulfovibrio sp. TomC]
MYAPLGPTHEAIEDLALMRALPGMCVVAVADAEEMRRLMPLTVDYPGPMYIRLAKGFDPIVTDAARAFAIGKAISYSERGEALLVTTGITLGLAKEACGLLAAAGISTALLHMPTVKPFDTGAFLDHCSPVRAVLTIEEHSVIGGLGSAAAEVFAEAGFSGKRFRRLGIPDRFPDDYGSQASLMAAYGLTAQDVARTVQDLLGCPL